MVPNEIREMNTADFLLALDNEFDRARKFAFDLKKRIDGCEAAFNVPFVITYTAGEHLAIAPAGFKGWGFPKVQGFRGLYVVVVIEQHGAIAATRSLGVNDGVPVGGDDSRLEAPGLQHVHQQLGALAHRGAMRGYARHRTQAPKFL